MIDPIEHMPEPEAGETYISVDIETAGPNPTNYSLLSIGACVVGDPQRSFYVELQPINMHAVAEAMQVNQLSLERLAKDGVPPAEAMTRFEAWLKAVTPPDQRPIFVAFNAPFDWMFVNDYFHRYLGRNPFGHSAVDVKSYYMGLRRVRWSETSMRKLAPGYRPDQPLTHHALQDAQDQAELFRRMLSEASTK